MSSIKGKLHKVCPLITGEGKNGTWQSRVFVIDTNDQYNPLVAFKLFGDKIGDLEAFEIGDVLEVSYNLRSREHKENWYTEAQAWKVEKVGESQKQTSSTSKWG